MSDFKRFFKERIFSTNRIRLMIQKDFKQKYFLYCKNCIVDNISPKVFAQVKNNSYICKVIEIKEL